MPTPARLYGDSMDESETDGLIDSSLHVAVRYEDVEATRVALLEAGCRVNQIGLYRWSPLHESASSGCTDIVRLLLQHGGNPNNPDALTGSTAVHYAAKGGHMTCLSLLIEAGGRYDVKDSNGNSSLDVASSECKSFLEAQRVQNLMKMPLEQARKDVLNSCPLNSRIHNGCMSKKTAQSSVDEIQPLQQCERHSAWQSKQPNCQNGANVGFLHASFEYHSKKRYLKVRVWKVTDMNLSHPNSSSISAISLKCRLEPDKENNTKRKTEEIKVVPPSKKDEVDDEGRYPSSSYPSSFKFSKPLEYFDIDDSSIKEKTLHLQVCVAHKFTRKSYAVGDVTLPLQVAVTKLIKECYPVRPCAYADAPLGMRVLTSSEAASADKVSYPKSESDPDLRHRTLRRLLQLERLQWSQRASSDTQLKEVVCSQTPSSCSSSISLEMPEDEDECMRVVITATDNHSTKATMPTLMTSVLVPSTEAEGKDGEWQGQQKTSPPRRESDSLSSSALSRSLQAQPSAVVVAMHSISLSQNKGEGSDDLGNQPLQWRLRQPLGSHASQFLPGSLPHAGGLETCIVNLPGDCTEILIENAEEDSSAC